MKKVLFTLGTLLLLINLLPNQVKASTLNCSAIDGMSIFGYYLDNYKFIGAITNKYDSNSIANEYGAGSKYKINSIFNEYGNFGSKYGSYSAFNEYTNTPPIIINNDYKFVGYLTTNKYKTPNINTYEAVACATKSYSSSNGSMEDITFKDIPTNIQISQTQSESDYYKNLNNFYDSKAEDLNKKIETLTEQEQDLQNAKIAELETKIQETKI
ncbi:MAG: hypothetical protein WC662_01590 [Candidatus Paceibacterota bacterium]|jgi:hypothetical protein